jgi:uncharacterized protein YvpB
MRISATKSGEPIVIVDFLYKSNDSLKAIYIKQDGTVNDDNANSVVITDYDYTHDIAPVGGIYKR